MTTPRVVRKQGQSRRRRLSLESMERRELLTTYLVTNNTDTGLNSLRQAITSANADPGPDIIQFQLTAGNLTIAPKTPLPAVTAKNLLIDGTQQAGYATGKPVVVLSGASAGASDGLDILGGSTTISGLIINGFAGAGLGLSGIGNDVVTSSWIGTDATGNVAVPNTGDGIDITTANNTIGGTTAGQGVVVSGNGPASPGGVGYGVALTGAVANRNIFQNDTIGLGYDRATALGNKLDGIFIQNGTGNTIGGVGSGTRNVISANANGVTLGGGANLVQGNFIGTDGTGTIARPNTANGVLVTGTANTVGGTSAGQGNLLSGNTQEGVGFNGAGARNLVEGNKIGVAVNGTSPLGNGVAGVGVTASQGEVIGGLAPGAGNIIAFNGASSAGFGVALTATASSITIQSNSIYGNAGGGISLGTTAGGFGNNDQPAPTIATAQTGGNQTVIQGQLNFPTGGGKQYTIQFFTNPTPDPAGQYEGQTLIGTINVTADVGGVAPFKVTFPFSTTVGQFVTATATQQGTQNTSAFSAAVPIAKAQVSDLSVAIAADHTPTDPFGTNVTYTITVKNLGPNDATNVVLTGVVDSNSAIVSATPPTGSTDQVSYTATTITDLIASLPAGQTDTLTVVVTPIGVGTITLNASVTADQIDPVSGNNTASSKITVVPAADLAIDPAQGLVAEPSPVGVGGQLTYVLTVVNNGPNNADNTQEVLTLPAGVSFSPSDITASQGTFTINGNQIDLAAGLVPPNAAVTLRVVVTPSTVGTLTATATASADEADPNPNNNSATVVTQVQNAVDIGVVVVASPNPVITGQPLTYTATITNHGPSDATGVSFIDTLPGGVTFNSASASNGSAVGNSGGTVSSSIGSIPSGQSVVVTIQVTPNITTGTITNTATVSDTAEVDTNPANNTATTPVLVSPADVSVSLVGNEYPAIAGQPLTYTLTVHNGGPAPATNLVAALNIPAGVKIDSITSSGIAYAFNGNLVEAVASSFAPGATGTVTIVVTPPISTLLSVTAKVTSDQIDPNPANNTSTSVIPVSPTDVAVAGSASSSGVLVGDPINLTFFVENGGPTAANNVVFTEVLPSNATVTSVVSSLPNIAYSIANGVLTWNVGTLAGSSFQAIVVTVVPTATGTLTSTGTVVSSSYDSAPSNNSATVSAPVTNAPGVFEFSSAGYSVPENGGSITITIDRVHGTLGPATVNYTTGDDTAIAGVNYAYTAGTVNFASGQTSATLIVPVFQDRVQTPNLDFKVGLTGTTAGAIGSPAAATVTVVNVDRDLVPPVVTSVVPEFNGSTIPAFVVNFSKPLDPASAGNAANYGLALSGNDYKAGLGFPTIPVAAVGYSSGSTSVTIFPSFALPLNLFYALSINGVRDYHGNLLSGAGNGVAGGSFGQFVGLGTALKYNDGFGNSVNLQLNGGGLMLINRDATGNALTLEVLGPVAGRSHLSGGVVRGRFGTGSTVIYSVTGLGAFGTVVSSLTTPPFYVLDPGFTPAPAPAVTATPAAALGAYVPLGPAGAARKKATF